MVLTLTMPIRTFVASLFLLLASISANAKDVSYEEILASPDDIKLSYLYAQQQVIKGDLEQATSALERVLLLQPNWDTARLFYAAVLFRLDDAEGAKRELKLLQDRPLSANQQREVSKYLALATAKSKKTRLTGSIATGFRVDSNPDMTTSSSNDLNGNPLDTDERVDGAFLATSNIRLEHNLPGGSGNFAFIEANGNLNEQFQVSEADYLTGGVRAGASFFLQDLQLTPYVSATALELQEQLYRSEYGGGLTAKYTVDPKLSLSLGAQGIYQDYRAVSDDSVGSARDGWLYVVAGGIAYRTSETNRISARINGYQKQASNDSYSYEALELIASDVFLLGRGQYVLASASYRWQNYDQPDPKYSATIARKDRLFKARVAYGIPVDTLLDFVNVEHGSATSGLNVQIGANYLNQDSNIPNFDADSLSADILFTKRFAY